MPSNRFLAATTAVLTLSLGATAFAQQDFSGELRARQGQMQMMAHNLGIVGNMARGNTPYDAELAQLAAGNLVTLAAIHPGTQWSPGSDNDTVENTRALPVIWEDYDRFLGLYADLGTAAGGLQSVAGDGLDALRGAMGPMGGACGACHDDFRQPND